MSRPTLHAFKHGKIENHPRPFGPRNWHSEEQTQNSLEEEVVIVEGKRKATDTVMLGMAATLFEKHGTMTTKG